MEDVTDLGRDGGEAEAGDEAGDGARETDKQGTEVLAGDDEETLGGGAQVLKEVTNFRGLADDGANGASEASQAQAGEEARDVRGQADQQVLGIRASDGQDVLDLGSEVLDKVVGGVGVAALEVVANGGNDLTDGRGGTGQDLGEDASQAGGDADKESAAIVADDGEEVLDGLAEVLDEVADLVGLLDDLANGASELRQAEANEETGDGAGELDQKVLAILANDRQGGVNARSNVRQDLVAGALAGDDASKALGGIGALARQNASREQTVQRAGSRGSNGGGSHSGEGSNERGLHCEDKEWCLKSDWSGSD